MINAYINGVYKGWGKMISGVLIEVPPKNIELRFEDNSDHSSENLAHYLSLLNLLKIIQKGGYIDCDIYIKSHCKMLVEQMNGFWKIKDGYYSDTAKDCLKLYRELESENCIKFYFKWVPFRYLGRVLELTNQ